MFRQFARLPLRRSLHSRAGSAHGSFARYTRSVYALGASATIAGYVAWSWSADGPRISLGSEAVSAPQKRPSSTTRTSPKSSDAPSQTDAPESATMSPEGAEPTPGPSESPSEGEDSQGESSGGAFNPETGEINWDCPCLGGMAHGPCGQQFRDAFSCFVYSEADPKGIDCVEKFKAMQDCFREHPDVYGDEIMDDDEEPAAEPATIEKTEENPHLLDSPPSGMTPQPSTPAS